jgi:N-acetylneuraminic acid mutarotase
VAFTLNGRGYFGLGYDANGNFLNDWWEFRPNSLDATKGTWTKKTNFPGTARANAVGFAIGDQGYVGTGDNILGDMESEPATYTGEFFEDFYRYDPFNNRWFQMRDYTSNKTDRVNISKKVTRAVGFSSRADNIGYIGFGIVPNDPVSRAQEDIWFYRPFVAGYK